jgi:hypothetical protein
MIRLRKAVLAACVLAASGAGISRGDDQTQPASREWFRDEAGRRRADDQLRGDERARDDRARDDRARADRAGRDGQRDADPPERIRVDGGYRPYSPYDSRSGYPSAEVYNWVVANARAATARSMFRRAETELGMAYRSAQRSFDTSQEMRDALKAEQQAYDELNAARRNALQSVINEKRYKNLIALREDLADQLARLRAERTIVFDEIVALATLKMAYATDLRAIEANALNGDGHVKEAQDKLVAAGARVAELRARYDESVRTNPEIMIAKRNLEDARLTMITADAYLHGSAAAGSEALDYAYYLHRRPGAVYYDDGYGYGYPRWRY